MMYLQNNSYIISIPNSPADIRVILVGPRFGVHTKCFDIFGKVRRSTLRIQWMTHCHPWAIREIKDGVQNGYAKSKYGHFYENKCF